MIVIVGSPIAEPAGHAIAAGGLSAAVALAAAGAGASVQIVGRVGEDTAGDQVLLALAAAGVGHVAVLREPGRTPPPPPPTAGESPSSDPPALGDALLDNDDNEVDGSGLLAGEVADESTTDRDTEGLSMDAADLELALRYLPDYRVVVLASDADPAALATVVAAAGWAGAHLIVLVATASTTNELPADATVLERPPADPDGAFARVVAAYAVALDQGREPRAAFDEASGSGGWAAVPN